MLKKTFKPVRERSAISPIIATLLLILIAISAGTVLYAYVMGFIGGTTQNPGVVQSTITIESSCVSSTGSGCNGVGYYIVIRNLGSNTISSSGTPKIQIYFTDSSTSATGVITCPISSAISPGSSMTCQNSLAGVLSPTSGDTIQIKVVMPDGGSALGTTKSL